MFTVTRIQTLKTEPETRSEKVPPIPTMKPVKMERSFSVDRELIKLTTSVNSGILLSRLIQLQNEDGGVLRDGKKWVGRTRQEWCEDTILSAGMLDRALQRLLDKNLVLTHKANIGGRVMVLIRQNEPIIEAELIRLRSLKKGK